jgi:hypothetical protein
MGAHTSEIAARIMEALQKPRKADRFQIKRKSNLNLI